MKKQLLITAALLMGSASYSYADSENVKPMPFATMDKNGDMLLTKDEVYGRLAANFEQLDVDGSGALSADELPMPGKGRKGACFAQMDKNGDGVLAKNEVGGRLLADFEQLDVDGNGTLSADEMPMQGKQGKGYKGKGRKGPRFAQMDKNNDGVLAKDEVGGRLLAHFEELDADGNGTLSENELPMPGKGRGGKHHRRATFAELDKDGNGSLSASEFAAQEEEGRAGKNFKRPSFAEMDKNGDGVLAKDEVCGRLLADFEQLDNDGSGTLSASELPNAESVQQDSK